MSQKTAATKKAQVPRCDMYKQVMTAINGLEIGGSRDIDIPGDLKYFRRMLSGISKGIEQGYKTKQVGGKLRIMRVEYTTF